MKKSCLQHTTVVAGLHLWVLSTVVTALAVLFPSQVHAQYQMSDQVKIEKPQIVLLDTVAGQSAQVNKTFEFPLAYDPSKITLVLNNPLLSYTRPVEQASTAAQVATPSATPSSKPAESFQATTPANSDSEKIVIGQATVTPTQPARARIAVQPAKAPAEFDHFFDIYGQQYGVDGNLLRGIARCESGMNPAAVSSNGLYYGLFQFVSSTWSSNRKALGADPDPSLMTNAEEAIKTAAFKISRDGIGAWPVCGKKAAQVASI